MCGISNFRSSSVKIFNCSISMFSAENNNYCTYIAKIRFYNKVS